MYRRPIAGSACRASQAGGAGGDVPPEVAELVHGRTGGNPLFVKEAADLLAAEGRLATPTPSRSGRAVPPGVQFVVRRRVSRLPVASQQPPAVAAVVGPAVDVELVAAAGGGTAAEALDRLAPAVDAGLLVDDGTGLRFSHALVADAVGRRGDAVRRAAIHAAAARSLAARAGADPAAAAAAHHAVVGMLAWTASRPSRRAPGPRRPPAPRPPGRGHPWANVATAAAGLHPPGRRRGPVEALVAQGQLPRPRPGRGGAGRARSWRPSAWPATRGWSSRWPACRGPLRPRGRLQQRGLPRRLDPEAAAVVERTCAGRRRRRPDWRGAGAAAGPGPRRPGLGARVRRRRPPPGRGRRRRRRGPGRPATPRCSPGCSSTWSCPTGPTCWRCAWGNGRRGRRPVRGPRPPARRHVRAHHARVPRPGVRRPRRRGGAPRWLPRRSPRGPAPAPRPARLDRRRRRRGPGPLRRGGRPRSGTPWPMHLHRRARGYDADVLHLAGLIAVAVDRAASRSWWGRRPTPSRPRPTCARPASRGLRARLEAGLVDAAAATVAGVAEPDVFHDDWTTVSAATAALHVRVGFGDAAAAARVRAVVERWSGRWANCGTAALGLGLVDLALGPGRRPPR